MPLRPESQDYEAVTKQRSATMSPEDNTEGLLGLRRGKSGDSSKEESASDWFGTSFATAGPAIDSPTIDQSQAASLSRTVPKPLKKEMLDSFKNLWIRKRAHAISFAGLFLFTFFLYFRPYELISSLSWLSTATFWIAIVTLAIFFPTQLASEGNLTARPREVNLILLFTVTGLLSIPLAINPGEAWDEFSQFLKCVLMFLVMVNVVRTEKRLKGLLWLILAASVVLSLGAINEYQAGRLGSAGDRIKGITGGMFGNPNDLALHLTTMVPIAVALFVASRGPFRKVVFALSAILMMAAIIVTFSRGGFLGLLAAAVVFAAKLGRRHKLSVPLAALLLIGIFLSVMPSELVGRLAATTNKGADAVAWASGEARRDLLTRSIVVSIANPVFGVGMGNFHIVGIQEQVSHNAYTQVSAEIGLTGAVLYVLFILAALKRMRLIERNMAQSESNEAGGEQQSQSLSKREQRTSRYYYYLAVGLHAGLIGYMVSSFFASVAYLWYVYYLVGFAFCLYQLNRQLTMKQQERIDSPSQSIASISNNGV